ncbi:MAG: hypothetical protein WKG00_35865 [Polyangiaceae bacterium]
MFAVWAMVSAVLAAGATAMESLPMVSVTGVSSCPVTTSGG